MSTFSQWRCDLSDYSPVQRLVLTVALVFVLGATAKAAGVGIALDASVISAGVPHAQSAGGCLAVDGSIGQFTTSQSAGGPFSLSAGFWPAISNRRTDSLFNNGFQECL
jgi:hypothetical protein